MHQRQQELLFEDSESLRLEEVDAEYFANSVSIKGAALRARYKFLRATRDVSIASEMDISPLQDASLKQEGWSLSSLAIF